MVCQPGGAGGRLRSQNPSRGGDVTSGNVFVSSITETDSVVRQPGGAGGGSRSIEQCPIPIPPYHICRPTALLCFTRRALFPNPF